MDDQRLEEIAKLVKSLEMAIQNAYAGSAEHGSFLRRGGGEWTPSVFMTLNRLREALASQEEELRSLREELETWKHCAHCHEPLQYPVYCQNAHGEEVQGLNLMLDESAAVQMPPKLNSNVSETRLSRSGCFQSKRRTRKPC